MKTFQKIQVLIIMGVFFVSCNKDIYEIAVPQPNGSSYTAKQLDSILQYYSVCNMQDIMTPAEIANTTFKQQFPLAKDIEWESGCNLYKVDFDIDKTDYQAVYDSIGNLLLYKHDMASRKLPKTVKNTIDSKYKDYRIDDADKVFMYQYTCYEVELDNKNTRDLEICVKEDGTVVYESID